MPRSGVAAVPPCTADALDGASEPGYQGAYTVTDHQGERHTYSGPLAVSVGVDLYQNEQGTFDNPSCAGSAGFEQPLRSASLASPPGATGSVACGYDLSRSTFSRTGDRITMRLAGTCALTQGGVTYWADTVEVRQGQIFERGPLGATQQAGAPAPVGLSVRWTESYTVSTSCVSESCRAPGRGGTGTASQPPPPPPAPAASSARALAPPVAPRDPVPPPPPPPAVPVGQIPADNYELGLSGGDQAAEVGHDVVPATGGGAGTWWHHPLVILALAALAAAEITSYRKQRRAGLPVFPLLARLRRG